MNVDCQLEVINRLTEKLDRTEGELSRKIEILSVHQAYMGIIERLNPKYGTDMCQDGLSYDVRQLKNHLVKESLTQHVKEENEKRRAAEAYQKETEGSCLEPQESVPECTQEEPSPICDETPSDSYYHKKKLKRGY